MFQQLLLQTNCARLYSRIGNVPLCAVDHQTIKYISIREALEQRTTSLSNYLENCIISFNFIRYNIFTSPVKFLVCKDPKATEMIPDQINTTLLENILTISEYGGREPLYM